MRLKTTLAVVAALLLSENSVAQDPRDVSQDTPWPVRSGKVKAVVNDAAVTRLRKRAVEERSSALAVAIDGKLILMEGSNEPIGAMSVSKSFVSLAIGFLVDDGTVSIEDPVSDWVPEWRDSPHAEIRIRHFLNHTSGLDATRAALDGGDIASHAIGSDLLFTPGSQFFYCNNAVDFLAVVVQRASGTALDDLLQERLFSPLGITDARWLEDVHGVPFAAGELQIRPTALLAVGQMLADGGVWKDRRIISEAWISTSTAAPQPYFASRGLLWRLRGEFRLALTPLILDKWRDSGLSEDILTRAKPLADQSFASYAEYWNELVERLGEDGLEEWRQSLSASRTPYAEEVLSGSSDGFYAEGWLGQYLVVLPRTRTVAVRMRKFMKFDTESEQETFNYSEFVDDVAALARLSNAKRH